MIRRPPRSTRTDTRFPYTTLFRSEAVVDRRADDDRGAVLVVVEHRDVHALAQRGLDLEALRRLDVFQVDAAEGRLQRRHHIDQALRVERSEERRVGKECVSTCRSRWSPYH